MIAPSRMHRWLLVPAFGVALLPLLACGSSGLVASSGARWACPSPTPLPFGPSGPVKAQRPLPTSIPSGPQTYENVYYEPWEQEYGAASSGPPFPTPTPYGIRGTTFLLSQRVEAGATHVTVTADAGPDADRPGVPAHTQQVHFIHVQWLNHRDAPIPVDYATQLRLREVQTPVGGLVTSAAWALTADALRLAALPAPPASIPVGASGVTIPIIGPVGTPHTVELDFTLADAEIITPTPQPNTDLHQQRTALLTIQWTAGSLADIGPSCADAGVITPWEDGKYVAWGRPVAPNVPIPPGADRLIALVLKQVGKSYIWGAKGPEAFDCSGLVSWAYGQIGVRMPQGTAGQWPQLRAISQEQVQPGDLVFFDIDGTGQIDHVGMLVGDLDGDGRWDMVHAANPTLGVRIDTDVLHSHYYGPRIRGFRTAR